MTFFITKETPVSEPLLNLLAHLPSEHIEKLVESAFFQNLKDEHFMRLATYLAEKSFSEGGCPIGAVIIDSGSRRILGKGHNLLGQDNDATTHGETAAIRDAGRVAKIRGEGPVDFRRTTLYTTLTPCAVCCAQIKYRCQFEKIVIGDITNAPSTEETLRAGGAKQILILEDAKALSLYQKYMKAQPKMHYMDWGGHQKWEDVSHKM